MILDHYEIRTTVSKILDRLEDGTSSQAAVIQRLAGFITELADGKFVVPVRMDSSEDGQIKYVEIPIDRLLDLVFEYGQDVLAVHADKLPSVSVDDVILIGMEAHKVHFTGFENVSVKEERQA